MLRAVFPMSYMGTWDDMDASTRREQLPPPGACLTTRRNVHCIYIDYEEWDGKSALETDYSRLCYGYRASDTAGMREASCIVYAGYAGRLPPTTTTQPKELHAGE